MNPYEDDSPTLTATTISDETQFIEDFLRPNLPYGLPLLRRCQFHCKRKHHTPSAEIWIVATSRNEKTTPDSSVANQTVSPADTPWLAAHIDLTVSGQTQIWTFASWEPVYANEANPCVAVHKSSQHALCSRLCDALFEHLKRNHISKLEHTPPDQWQRLKTEGKIVSEPFSRSKVLFGTIAECLWPFLEAYRIDENTTSAISRKDIPYLKYIVKSTADSLTSPVATAGLHFAPMPDHHLQTIIDRTAIPRTLETLRQLPNIGLFDEEGTPVAWGLLGKDGSLSSLHTEPEYRGRGLAELIGSSLMSQQMEFFEQGLDSTDADEGDENVVYSMSDVSESNGASRRVMEKLGARVMWRVAWIELQLGEA